MLQRPHFLRYWRDILDFYIMYPSATFHFYEKNCILKFLLIKFDRDREILPILLIKISRYKFFHKNEKFWKGL